MLVCYGGPASGRTGLTGPAEVPVRGLGPWLPCGDSLACLGGPLLGAPRCAVRAARRTTMSTTWSPGMMPGGLRRSLGRGAPRCPSRGAFRLRLSLSSARCGGPTPKIRPHSGASPARSCSRPSETRGPPMNRTAPGARALAAGRVRERFRRCALVAAGCAQRVRCPAALFGVAQSSWPRAAVALAQSRTEDCDAVDFPCCRRGRPARLVWWSPEQRVRVLQAGRACWPRSSACRAPSSTTVREHQEASKLCCGWRRDGFRRHRLRACVHRGCCLGRHSGGGGGSLRLRVDVAALATARWQHAAAGPAAQVPADRPIRAPARWWRADALPRGRPPGGARLASADGTAAAGRC